MKLARIAAPVLVTLVLFSILAAPVLVSAQINIWKDARCGGTAIITGGPTGPCNFCDALFVARNIIQLLLEFALIAAALMIAVGALMMMTSGGSEERFASGKKTILNAVIGAAIALCSWLVINVVLQFLSGAPNLPWNQITCS